MNICVSKRGGLYPHGTGQDVLPAVPLVIFSGGLSGGVCGGRAVSARHHQHPAGRGRQINAEPLDVRLPADALLAIPIAGLAGAAAVFHPAGDSVLSVPLPQRGSAAVLRQFEPLPALHHCLDRGGGVPGQPGGRAVRQRGCPGAGRLYAGHGGGPHLERGYVQLLRRAPAGAVLGHGGLALPVWVGEFPPPRLGCSGSAALLRRLRYL